MRLATSNSLSIPHPWLSTASWISRVASFSDSPARAGALRKDGLVNPLEVMRNIFINHIIISSGIK